MKKLTLLLLFLPILVFAQRREPVRMYKLNNFTGGFNFKDISTKLDDNESPNCQNVLFDENNTIYSTKGYSLFANLPVNGNIYLIDEFKRQSGEMWLMVHVATSVYASDDDGGTWVKVTEGLKEISGGNAVTYADEWWFTNGIDDVFSWNTSTKTAYGFIPQGKYIEVHNNQLFVGNVPENYSAIFWCSNVNLARTAEGWDYYNSFIIGENDGDTITALKSEGSVLTITKDRSVWYLAGDGFNYNVPVKYTDVYGCISQKSYNKYKGNPLMLSKEGLCTYGGGNIAKVDNQVEEWTKKATVSVGTIVGKYWTQTTENDFNLGTSSDVVVTNGVIKVMSSNTEQADTINTFGEGVYTTINRNVTPVENEYRSSFGGDANTLYEITDAPLTKIIVPLSPHGKSYALKNLKLNLKRTNPDLFQSSVTVRIYDIADVLKGEQTRWINDLGNGDWYTFFSTFNVTVSQTSKIKVYRRQSEGGNSGFDYLAYYAPYLRYEYARERTSSDAEYAARQRVWAATGWEIVRVELISGQGTRPRQIQLRRQITERINRSWFAIQYEYVVSPSTHGYFTSQKYNAGTSINTWKHFVTADFGDSIDYQIKYATGSTALDAASWNSIENGGLIAATTSQHWVQWKATLNDKYQSIESVLLRWFESNSADYQDCSSAYFDNKYHLSIATYGYTNSMVLVFDDNERFTKLGINAEAMGVYDNELLFGSSNALYKMYDTWNFDGSAIDAYWESKDLDFGDPDRDKEIVKIGVTHKGSGTLEVGYKSNYDTTFTTFGVTMGSTVDNDVVNIDRVSPAKYWRVRVRNNTVDEYFEVPEIRIYYRFVPLIAR